MKHGDKVYYHRSHHVKQPATWICWITAATGILRWHQVMLRLGGLAMKIRVSDVFNSENDIRKNMSVGMNYEIEEDLADDFGIDVDDIEQILKYAQIYINGNTINQFVNVDPVEGE